MPAPPPDAGSQRATVREVRPSGSDGVVLTLDLEQPFERLRAGRFFMLRRDDALSPAIPRPFSVFRQREDGGLEFLIKVMGAGTRALAACRAGDRLVAVGPLGNGWPVLEASPAEPLVMVAGGIGSAPFHMAIEDALAGVDGAAPADPSALCLVYGGRHEGLLYDLAEFEALGVPVIACTDDGSRGFHGNVVQALEAAWERGDLPRAGRVLTCGPDPMMRAVVATAAGAGMPSWVSLETYMGCGVGICNGCAVPTCEEGPMGSWPFAKCCVDGPVFATEAIDMAAVQH